MRNKVATVVSYLLHPLLLPTFLLVAILRFLPDLFPSEVQMLEPKLILVVFVSTFVIPLICIVSMKISHMINTFTMQSREERKMPFLFTAIFYVITSYLFIGKLHFAGLVSSIILAITVVIVLVAIFTFFMKISAHAAGISGALGIVVYIKLHYPQEIVVPLIVVIIALWGILMSARLQLGVHSQKEMYLGSAVGFIGAFSSLYLFP